MVATSAQSSRLGNAKGEERDYCSICKGKFISQGLYFEGKQSLMSEREDETCRDRPSVCLKKNLLVRGTQSKVRTTRSSSDYCKSVDSPVYRSAPVLQTKRQVNINVYMKLVI